MGQVDWGQVRTRFVCGPVEVHVFVMTLGYSRRAWAEGYENERMGALRGGPIRLDSARGLDKWILCG